MLAHDLKIRSAIEPKPNEPMDHTYIPMTGHALAHGWDAERKEEDRWNYRP